MACLGDHVHKKTGKMLCAFPVLLCQIFLAYTKVASIETTAVRDLEIGQLALASAAASAKSSALMPGTLADTTK